MNILFACGGTAGHVNPAVGLAHMFQQRRKDVNVIFVGAEGGMENRLVPKEGYAIKTVSITNLRRSMAPKAMVHNLRTLGNVYRSKVQSNRILTDFPPDLVVGTGGYASYPIVMEAAKRGIPTAIHESNVIPGLTTKSLAKVVDCVMVGFSDSAKYYPRAKKVVVTGTPIREDFFKYTKEEARAILNMKDDRPLLLSYWGSLGASGMNKKMIDVLAKECYEGAPFRHIHGAGRDFKGISSIIASKGLKLGDNGVELVDYIYNMGVVMAAADVVLCRAGASTIAELVALQKPSILVPSPNVTANHQEKNARILADQGGALLLLEENCLENTLYQTAEGLLRETQRRDSMTQVLATMTTENPKDKIYNTLLSLMR